MRRCMFDAVPDSAKLPRHLASGPDAEETDIKPYTPSLCWATLIGDQYQSAIKKN